MDASITRSIDLAGLTLAGPASLQAFVNTGVTRFTIGTTSAARVSTYRGVSPTGGSPFTDSITLQIGSATPEPSSIALIGLGLGAIGLVMRRRKL